MTSEQKTSMQQNAFTLVMRLPQNTKIAKTLSIFVTTNLTMALRQNGIFLPLVMAKACDGIGYTVKRLTPHAS